MKRTKEQNTGALFIVLSALFFGSYGIWSKLMAGFFGEFNQAGIRGLLISIILVIIGVLGKKFKKIDKKDLLWFLLISLAGGLNQAPYFYAFEKLEVGTATMLFYASLTIGDFIWGKLFFKEKMTPIKIGSLILAMIGMGFIYGIKLSGGIPPLFMAILAGLMGATEVVFTKKISSKYSTIQILIFIFGTMFICNTFISLFLGETIPVLTLNKAWLGQLGYTLSMLGALYSVVIGFKYLEASIAALIGLLEIVFATIFGVFFFKEILSFGILSGGGLILLSAALPEINSLKKVSKD